MAAFIPCQKHLRKCYFALDQTFVTSLTCGMKPAKQGVRHVHPTYGQQKDWPRITVPMPPHLLDKIDRIWHKRMLRNRAAAIHALILEASEKSA
jgi:hypothetical protein